MEAVPTSAEILARINALSVPLARRRKAQPAIRAHTTTDPRAAGRKRAPQAPEPLPAPSGASLGTR